MITFPGSMIHSLLVTSTSVGTNYVFGSVAIRGCVSLTANLLGRINA